MPSAYTPPKKECNPERGAKIAALAFVVLYLTLMVVLVGANMLAKPWHRTADPIDSYNVTYPIKRNLV